MSAEFIHLQVHSDYSLIDSIVSVSRLVEAAKQQQMTAIALTDQMNLFAAVKFYQAAIAQGIKPILGCDVWMPSPWDQTSLCSLTLLSQTPQGYQRLLQLISQAYTAAKQRQTPVIERAWLAENNAGLLVLSGAQYGDIGQALLQNKTAQAHELAQAWQRDFPDRFYLQLQRMGQADEEHYIQQVLPLATQLDLPVVATNAVCFLQPEDYDAHEARVCIHQGFMLADPHRPQKHTAQQFFRSAEQMAQVFADIPEALANSVEIAKRCSVPLTLGEVHLPNFPLPENTTVTNHLIKSAQAGLIQRLQTLYPDETQREQQQSSYEQRLIMELEVINQMGFAGYFLIVADFIQWAKQHHIPVGPGRGSGAGSLVAYALQITDLDPLTYDLLFERFLNPERVSMPDFDIDFCMIGRDQVIDYVADKYGRDSVAQIITYGSMAARAVVRDVGRVLGHGYGFVDKIAKLIPFEIGMTLTKALQQEELLRQRYEQEEEVTALLDLALKLEGLVRNVGKHAGGVVIAPSALTDFVPLYCEAGEPSWVTQFDKDDVETVGLVKFDFLGLRTLTIIQWTLDQINQPLTQCGDGDPISIEHIPLDDVATYDLLKSCQTTAVFQLESRGMKDLIKRLQPDCFGDIVALVALFRPGPLQSGMVDDFIQRKHGQAQVSYPHPDLEPILQSTYGVILYQEQVMQIAQVLAGYTLGAADLLRRAMGKKKPEEMAKQRSIFLTGATERGVDARVAESIFDLMEKFAGYGFNKSHSVAYALLAYQTAWLKTHYPAAFMAAVLSSDLDNTDKIVILLEDCRHLGLTVLPPDIHRCEYRFTVVDEATIAYGLGAIKGIGEAAIDHIRQTLQAQGQFTDLFDLCRRLDLGKVNRRVIEAFIRCGGLDAWQVDRAALMASVDMAFKAAEQHQQAQAHGQCDLFDALPTSPTDEQTVTYATCPPWSDLQRLQAEKDTLGIYLSGHPVHYYRNELQHIVTSSLAQVNPQVQANVTIAGLITQSRRLQTKRGDRMAVLTLEDGEGRIDVTLFSETLQTFQALIAKDQMIVVRGQASVDQFTEGYRVVAEQVYDLPQARQQFADHLAIRLHRQQLPVNHLPQLQQILTMHQGGQCVVSVYYQQGQAAATLQLGQQWRVQPTDELVTALRNLYGEQAISFVYRGVE